MSRTYRRKGFDWEADRWYTRRGWQEVRTPEQFRAKYHSDAQRTMRMTPSWWTNTFMTRPQRAEVRRLTHKVMRLNLKDLDDAPLFPLAKKPHLYYW